MPIIGPIPGQPGGSNNSKANKIFTSTSGASDGMQMAGSQKDPEYMSYGQSMEQIVSPLHIGKGWSYSPGFQIAGGSAYERGEYERFESGTVGPTLAELNPYYSNVLPNFFSGTDFVHALNASGLDDEGDNDANLKKLKAPPYQVAVHGLRGPLILSGWGYDIADRPTPCDGSDLFSFLSDMQGNRATWKSGPVNLQWDDERQVWQGGPQIVCGIVKGGISAPKTPCSPTTFTVQLLRLDRGGVSTCFGANQWDERITVRNRDPSLEEAANENMIFCIAVRINYEWLPIWVGCPDPLTTEERNGRNFGCTSCSSLSQDNSDEPPFAEEQIYSDANGTIWNYNPVTGTWFNNEGDQSNY